MVFQELELAKMTPKFSIQTQIVKYSLEDCILCSDKTDIEPSFTRHLELFLVAIQFFTLSNRFVERSLRSKSESRRCKYEGPALIYLSHEQASNLDLFLRPVSVLYRQRSDSKVPLNQIQNSNPQHIKEVCPLCEYDSLINLRHRVSLYRDRRQCQFYQERKCNR